MIHIDPSTIYCSTFHSSKLPVFHNNFVGHMKTPVIFSLHYLYPEFEKQVNTECQQNKYKDDKQVPDK
jgi:hypothetical protein